MPDRNRDFPILSDFTSDDYETAIEGAFGDSPIEPRLRPLVKYFRSIATSFEASMSRPDLPSRLRASLDQLLALREQWVPPGFEPASVGLARLVAESDASDFEFGYRGTGQRERLIFTSEIGEVELDISPVGTGDQYIIRCQIEPEDAAEKFDSGEAFLVQVSRADQAIRESFDSDGFFSIATHAGVFDLTIVSGSRAVRLAGIEVG